MPGVRAAVSGAALAGVALVCKQTIDTLGYLKAAHLDFHAAHGSFGGQPPSGCTLIGGGSAPGAVVPTAVEDLAVYDRERGLLLGGGGNVWLGAVHGVRGLREKERTGEIGGESGGGTDRNWIYLVDAAKGQAWPLRTFRQLADGVFARGQDSAPHGGAGADPAAQGPQFAHHSLGDHLFHGVSYSPTSKRLYLVNHRQAYSSVEVFEVREAAAGELARIVGKQAEARPEGAAGGAGAEPPAFHATTFLVHVHSVRSPLFMRFALNDVAELAKNGSSLLVTEWKDQDANAGGAASNSAWEDLKMKATNILKLRNTRVFRCELASEGGAGEEAWRCAPATRQRFVSANGLGVSPDRKFAVVADPPAGQLHVFENVGGASPQEEARDALRPVASIHTAHLVDNVDVAAVTDAGPDGDAPGANSTLVLAAGSIPLPHTCAMGCEAGFGVEQRVTARRGVPAGAEPQTGTVGCGRAPGGLLEVRLGGLYAGGAGAGQQQQLQPAVTSVQQSDVLLHDGSVLSDVSCGALLGARVALGSPLARGVLVCEV